MGFIIRGFTWDILILFLLMFFFGALEIARINLKAGMVGVH